MVFFAKMRKSGAPGWIAQWSELKQQQNIKIARPRQLYLGPDDRTPEF
jgi:citrate synthase